MSAKSEAVKSIVTGVVSACAGSVVGTLGICFGRQCNFNKSAKLIWNIGCFGLSMLVESKTFDVIDESFEEIDELVKGTKDLVAQVKEQMEIAKQVKEGGYIHEVPIQDGESDGQRGEIK